MRASTPSPAASPVPGSVGSSTPDYSNQQRLKDVHKKYRIVEGTRRIYHGESEGILRRQEAALAKLRTDNKSLQGIVDTYFIPNFEQRMAQLGDEAEKYGDLVDVEAKRLEELDIAFEKSKAKRLDFKRAQGGVNASLDNHRYAMTHIQILENRIHKAVVDLNLVERQNRSLKRKLGELKEERELFDHMRFKIERELQWKEKEMEKCIEMTSQMYDERNDIEERYTDALEIYGDMEAYKMWKETKGWSVMAPEPVENFLHVQPKSEEPKEVMESSEYFRQWIDIKAIGNLQDILKVDRVDDIAGAVQRLQQKNAAIIERMNELVIEMDTIKAQPRSLEVTIESGRHVPTAIPLARKQMELETLIERISGLLKDLNFDDDEIILIINEMKRRVGRIFKEAGCPVDENEVSNEKGKARLEEALGQWYNTIDNFVDQLIKEATEAKKK